MENKKDGINILSVIGSLVGVLVGLMVFFSAGYLLGRDSADSLNDQLVRELKLYQAANDNKTALEYLAELKTYNESIFDTKKFTDKISKMDLELSSQKLQNNALEKTNKSYRKSLRRKLILTLR